MTQEDIELLLKDLSARLSYGVKVKTSGGIGKTVESITIKPDYIEITIKGIYAYSHFIYKDTGEWDKDNDLSRCKPYLRSMSSMTKEEKETYYNLCYEEEREEYEFGDWVTKVYYHDTIDSIDWLNKNHFDYRGLIPKGLAIEVTDKNNPYKE